MRRPCNPVYYIIAFLWASAPGCLVVPEIAHQPMVHNPFPQLSKIAVAPFFNLSTEASADGRLVALAYFNELQAIQGYEVVPVGVVEQTMSEYGIGLTKPEEARRLAQILQVDAVVIGAITDFDPYFPPRMTLQVEWYPANPCFHPIPPGYALPWGSSEESLIPDRLRLATEMAVAQAQLKTQTPEAPLDPALEENQSNPSQDQDEHPAASMTGGRIAKLRPKGELTSLGAFGDTNPVTPNELEAAGEQLLNGQHNTVPPDWPDPHGLIPRPPSWERPECLPTGEPVMRHVASFDSRDEHFSTALKSYVSFREPLSRGEHEGYLHRMPDFVRFCCHYHIYEMLSARGGADETRVVYRWIKSR